MTTVKQVHRKLSANEIDFQRYLSSNSLLQDSDEPDPAKLDRRKNALVLEPKELLKEYVPTYAIMQSVLSKFFKK